MVQKLTNAEFDTAWERALGSPARVAELTGLSIRQVYKRRQNRESSGQRLPTNPADGRVHLAPYARTSAENPNRLEFKVHDGTILIGSDAHYWPGEASVAHRAFVQLTKALKPVAVILNGDILDGASISRHDKLGWQQLPNVKAELDAVKERLSEIELAAPKGCARLRTIGNHDLRFDRYLASNAPAFEGVPGSNLKDHIPLWEDAWSIRLIPSASPQVAVKHRLANGLHSAYNNTLRAGTSIVTGHLHRLLITPWGDYNGRRWGVDTGTLADINGPQFAYTEDNPSSGCSGFAVLSFHQGVLAPPELVEVIEGQAWFRGSPL